MSWGMKAKTSTETFEQRLEQLVREHIAAIRAQAEAALARGFAELPVRAPAPAASLPKLSPHRPASRRRTSEQVAELAQRLCAAVHAAPGQTMLHLAPQVGATPAELSVAVAHLRRQGRLRTVGQRQYTRYFPAAPAPVPAS